MEKLNLIKNSKDTISGIYLIKFSNGKVYVGLSNNIIRRMKEHNTDYRHDLPLTRAIQKYGKISDFYLLESINADNRKKLQERESYWINYYQSNTKEKGYNLTSGGDGADIGANNVSAKFTEDEILQVISDIKNSSLSLKDIAKKYNTSPQAISKINNGISYFHKTENYPLRNGNAKDKLKGANNSKASLTQEQANEIYELLKNTKIPMREIAKKYSVSDSLIHNINKGTGYFSKNNIYPLRKTYTRKK